MSVKDQGHVFTFIKFTQFSKLNFVFLINCCAIESKFYVKASGRIGKKDFYKWPGHMTKMTAMPIY